MEIGKIREFDGIKKSGNLINSPSYSGQIVLSETFLFDIITMNKACNKQIYVLQIYVYDFGEDGRPLEYPNNILPEYVIEVEVS